MLIFLRNSLAAGLICLQFIGCSTVFGRHQDDQMVTFNANVQDVEINCSGKQVITPGSIPLKQSKNHSCTAVKEGYEKKAFRVESGTSWGGFGHSTATNTAIWGWWTLGIGTVIGWLVDWPSGAMRNLKEEDIRVELRPQGEASTAEKLFEKTTAVGKTLINTPVDVVQETTSAALDATVRGSATQLGVENQKEVKKMN